MIRESVPIVSCGAGGIEVALVTGSACRRCSARAGCGQPLLARLHGEAEGNRLLLPLPSECRARPGDIAELAIAPASLLWASIWLYAVPVMGVLAGGLAGQALGGADFPGVVGALAGGTLCWLLSRHRMRGRENPVRVVAITARPAEAENRIPGVKVL